MASLSIQRFDYSQVEGQGQDFLNELNEEITQAMCKDGVVIIENALSKKQTDQIVDELSPFIQVSPLGTGGLERGRRIGALVARSKSSHAAIAHPAVMHICKQLLGAQAREENQVQFMQRSRGEGDYQWRVGLTQVIDILPGQERQGMHRGNGLWGHDFVGQGLDMQIETMWALTDFTEENGATHVIPGSHRWADVTQRSEERGAVTWFGKLDQEDVQASMDAGSVLVWTGWTVHGAGANKSDQERIGMNIDYTLAFLSQEENQFLACPPHIARELSEEIRHLIGYRQDGVALNYVADVQTPQDVIRAEFDVLDPNSKRETPVR